MLLIKLWKRESLTTISGQRNLIIQTPSTQSTSDMLWTIQSKNVVDICISLKGTPEEVLSFQITNIVLQSM